jgi:hypothetical protein
MSLLCGRERERERVTTKKRRGWGGERKRKYGVNNEYAE